MRRPASLALALAAPALLAGCLGTQHGRPEGRGTRTVAARGRPDVAVPERWEQILHGDPPHASLLGYLKTSTSGPDVGTQWVYDANFNLVGRVSPRGKTHNTTRRAGVELDEGNYVLRHSLLKLFRLDRDDKVNLASMPAPKG